MLSHAPPKLSDHMMHEVPVDVSTRHIIPCHFVLSAFSRRGGVSGYLVRSDLCIAPSSLQNRHPGERTFGAGWGFLGYKKGAHPLHLFHPTPCLTSSIHLSCKHNSPSCNSAPHCKFLYPAMPSHDELVGKKYGSMQDYYTRFPNSWARIRYDAVTHQSPHRPID